MSESSCGRPTRAGTPCKNRPGGKFQPGCSTHSTDEEQRVAELQHKVYWEGYHAGVESGIDRERSRAECEERNRVRNIEQAERDRLNFRLRTSDDRQIVQCGHLTWAWRGVDLQVGDVVLVPPPFWFGERAAPVEEAVTALGSSYVGHLVNILSVVRKAVAA